MENQLHQQPSLPDAASTNNSHRAEAQSDINYFIQLVNTPPQSEAFAIVAKMIFPLPQLTDDPIPLQLSVLESDIRNGRKSECSGCPIALAIRRALHLDYLMFELIVGFKQIRLCVNEDNGRTVAKWESAPAMLQFINHFDCNSPVEPFDFVLEVPRSLTHLIGAALVARLS